MPDSGCNARRGTASCVRQRMNPHEGGDNTVEGEASTALAGERRLC